MARVLFPLLQRWWRRVRTPGEPRIVRFAATRLPVAAGGVVTLAWQVDGAASVRIEPGLGEVPPRGALRTRVLPADGRYELIAEAGGGSVRAACRIRGPIALTDALAPSPSPAAAAPASALGRTRVRFAAAADSPRVPPASHHRGTMRPDLEAAPIALDAADSGAPGPIRRRAAARGLAPTPAVAPPARFIIARPHPALRAVARVPTFDPRDLPA